MDKYKPMLIDASEIITTMVMDEKAKTGTYIKMPIADALEKWTVEGCPKPVKAEPKHGMWIDGKCSVCGSLRPINKVIFRGETIWERAQEANYCPYCGAKMDENGNESELNPCRDYDEKVDRKAILGFPSTQPEPIQINLNESIKVKLTDWGKEVYYHRYDRINQTAGKEICKPRFPKEDENGYTKFQLWDFMELYGGYIGLTMPNVIKPLEIVYER